MSDYFTILTQTGQAKLAASLAGGPPLVFSEMAIGDGGGAAVVVTDTVTALVNEVHRQALTYVSQDPDNPSWTIAETVLTPSIGGWTIREFGIYDTDGDLIAYGNYPDSYKPVLSEGSSKELTIRGVIETSSTAEIVFMADPSVVLASQAWVTAQLKKQRPFRFYNSN